MGDNVPPIWLDQIRDDNRALVEVIESAMYAHDENLGAFLCFLGVRLLEMRRVLKETGNIYKGAGPLWLLLAATCWTHIGKGSVFGLGQLRIVATLTAILALSQQKFH